MQKPRFGFGPLMLALGLLLAPYRAPAQTAAKARSKTKALTTAAAATTGALLWEVTGPGQGQPSYVFGTFHLLNSDFLQAHPVILDKLKATRAVVGELVFDSTAFAKIGAASQLRGTTLDQLLKPEQFQRVDAALQAVTPYKLAMLNGVSPMAVMSLLTVTAWQKMHPQVPAALPMDVYVQQEGRRAGKPVIGLETVDEQIDVLFNGLAPARQAELLAESVKTPDALSQDLARMAQCYQTQDLDCVSRLLYDESYRPAEIDLLVAARTRAWLAPLHKQLTAQPTFVAVGAGHLVGPDGLLTLLRKAGYRVTAVPM